MAPPPDIHEPEADAKFVKGVGKFPSPPKSLTSASRTNPAGEDDEGDSDVQDEELNSPKPPSTTLTQGLENQMSKDFESIVEADEGAGGASGSGGASRAGSFEDTQDPEHGEAVGDLAQEPPPPPPPHTEAAALRPRLTGRTSSRRQKPKVTFVGHLCKICRERIEDDDAKDYGSKKYSCVRHVTCHNASKRLEYNASTAAQMATLVALKKNKEAWALKVLECKHAQSFAGEHQKDLVVRLLEKYVSQTKLSMQRRVVMLDHDGFLAWCKYTRNMDDEKAKDYWDAQVANSDVPRETELGVLYISVPQAKELVLERSIALERALQLPETRLALRCE